MIFMPNYTNMISDIDVITDNPENYPSNILKRAINEAYVVYESGNKSRDWYEQVKRICEAELARR